MIDAFKEHITKAFFELRDAKLILASSGGIDSMVLVDLCLKSDLQISIAHCNFKLRGAESDADQEFVKEFAKANHIEFYTTSFDTIAYKKEHGLSTQLAARKLRYNWFEELHKETNSDYVLTAHQQDDSLESFFINLSRGSGIEGLVGIPTKRGIYRRPLLMFSRIAIEDYAKSQKIQWREDASNADTAYLRNQIRHDFMDEFAKLHPTALDNLTKTISHLNDTANLANNYTDLLRSQLFNNQGSKTEIFLEDLLQLKPLQACLYVLFSDYGFTDSNAIIDLAASSSGKQLVSESHRLLKDRDKFILKPRFEQTDNEYTIEEPKSITEPISLNIKKVKALGDLNLGTIYVDASLLKWPLKLRKRKTADRFYPFGMKGAKKLSKFFKDEKFDQFSKEAQWLLCDADDQIIWVIGKRFDKRFQLSSTTSSILKISC